jgi:hypothetical protein
MVSNHLHCCQHVWSLLLQHTELNDLVRHYDQRVASIYVDPVAASMLSACTHVTLC